MESDAVSRAKTGKSADMSWPINNLRTHCVSRPGVEYFARFFNGYSDLQPHCVSRGLPVNSTQRIRTEPRGPLRLRLPNQTAAQSILTVVVRIAASPVGTRSSVALLLAARVAADVLAIAGAGVRHEPLPANPTRTLVTHAALRAGQRPADSSGREAVGSTATSAGVADPQTGGWVNSGEQRRVHSRER